MSEYAPLLNDATLAAIRAPFLQYLSQAARGPRWETTRHVGTGIGAPKASAAGDPIEGWVLIPPATQPATAPGQPTTTTAPQLFVTGALLPLRGDVLALATYDEVKFRVVGESFSLLFPTFIVEAL